MSVRTIGIIITVLAAVLAFSTYTVDERQRVILFSLGEIKATDLKPGLHFKLPFINNILKFDSRVLSLDAEPDRFLTAEKKNVTVDFFVKWRIDKVALFYRSFGVDEFNAQNRIAQITKDEMRNEFGKRTIQQVVSDQRGEIMDTLRAKVNNITKNYGVKILDVRMSRVDLPDEVNNSVYNRMRTERALAAKNFRARGHEDAVRIRATADRKRTVILAEAYRDAQRTRGEGDSRAAATYANAYSKDAEFYRFYRSLNAYINSFRGKNDLLIVNP
ncbi:MAG TPA: protease modulator HflC, partial [Gammaproteobacteria bacterium]|nr:protease modulator HflC [Gammaproteobacteria bacterium]